MFNLIHKFYNCNMPIYVRILAISIRGLFPFAGFRPDDPRTAYVECDVSGPDFRHLAQWNQHWYIALWQIMYSTVTQLILAIYCFVIIHKYDLLYEDYDYGGMLLLLVVIPAAAYARLGALRIPNIWAATSPNRSTYFPMTRLPAFNWLRPSILQSSD